MRLIINASIMISGVVVVDLNEDCTEGSITVIQDKTQEWATAAAEQSGTALLPEKIKEFVESSGSKDVVILKLLARAIEQKSGKSGIEFVVNTEEPKKEEVN